MGIGARTPRHGERWGRMEDVWFAAGLTAKDLDLCVKALALGQGARPPLIAVAGRDPTGPRLVLASRALFGVFGVADGEALSRRMLNGRDQGARRLAALQDSLPAGGAPRLERLRFSIGPTSEAMTFLCRRVLSEGGGALFVAAALNIRASLLAESAREEAAVPLASPRPADAVGPSALPAAVDGAATLPAPTSQPGPEADTGLPTGPLDIQAIQAALRRRWPSRQSLRFLWQSDASDVCTHVSPLLADIVGVRSADVVGGDLHALAARLDPSGRFEAALRSRGTWSGITVDWPIDGATAAVAVALGAIPSHDGDRAFNGYRGYGIARLDELVVREVPALPGHTPTAEIIAFPAKALSADDERTFAALAADLRDRAGLAESEEEGTASPPLADTIAAPSLPPDPTVAPAVPQDGKEQLAPATREGEMARNGLALVDRLAIGLLVSRDNVPILANRHFLELTGFADEDSLHEAGGLRHLFGHSPANASGAESVAVRRHDGTTFVAVARLQRIEWDALPATLLTLQSDARASKAPGASNREDDERRDLRAILETATDGVIVMDDACRVLSLNRAGEALFGLDRSEVVGKPFLDLFAPHDRTLAGDYLEGVKSDPAQSLLNDGREFLVAAAQGGTIPVFMTLGRLGPAPDGTAPAGPSRFCALFRDLTHWKKVEGELEDARHAAERASALKSDFLAKVSHEIRTPLNAIIGFAEVMLEERLGTLGNARYKDYIADIHGSGTHVMSLVNDLLDLSKIEAGKMELACDPIDANRIVSECVALMQPQASRERVILRMSLAAGLPRITADERSLRQITLNLLSNAVKFNEPGGQVIVATQRTETGTVVLRIRDTGPGMSDSDIAAALEPFRQLAPAADRTSFAGGTGLGLPLTKALVEANEAIFTIRSKVDQGTFVEVAFPPARVLAAE